MKKSIKLLLTLTSLLLVGCTTLSSTSGPSSQEEVTTENVTTEEQVTTSENQTTSENKVIEAYTLNVTAKNAFDGNLSGVKVSYLDQDRKSVV